MKTILLTPANLRREEFVKAAMQGLCASVKTSRDAEFVAYLSVKIADETLDKLDETKKE